MSATNHTANYELSQYIGSDEPKYLTDYNGDMSKIDTAIKTVETSATTANTGVATNASAISALDTAVGSLQTQVTTVAGVANGNTGSINTINSLIGSGEPTTSDKTIIGAINEIYADITGGGTDIEADNVTFDNTGTSLQATTVQDAIEELAQGGGSVDADDVSYDNTSSGLSATNVQSAIDEVNGKITGTIYDFDLQAVNNVTVTGATNVTVDTTNTLIDALLNADKSIGKIYGAFSCSISGTLTGQSWYKLATINAGLDPITTAYNIVFGSGFHVGSTAVDGAYPARLHFNTDGTVDIELKAASLGSGTYLCSLAPSILFLKDLGD